MNGEAKALSLFGKVNNRVGESKFVGENTETVGENTASLIVKCRSRDRIQ
jgi:hypothetical protein